MSAISMVNQPVLDVLFIGGREPFMFRFFPNRDSAENIEKIVARFAEDGYKPVWKSVRKGWLNDRNELEERGNLTSLLGYKVRSAFLRA